MLYCSILALENRQQWLLIFAHHSDPGDGIATGFRCGQKVNVFVEDCRLRKFPAHASLQSPQLHFRQRASTVSRKPLLIEIILPGQFLDDEGHIF